MRGVDAATKRADAAMRWNAMERDATQRDAALTVPPGAQHDAMAREAEYPPVLVVVFEAVAPEALDHVEPQRVRVARVPAAHSAVCLESMRARRRRLDHTRRRSPSRSGQADPQPPSRDLRSWPSRAAHFLVDGCTAGTMQKKTVANSRYASEYMLQCPK